MYSLSRTDEPVATRARGVKALTLLLGVLLTVFSFLVVPGVVLNGYFLRVMGSHARDPSTRGSSPPTFSNVPSLLKDGLASYVIWLVYAIVPFVVLMLSYPVAGRTFGAIESDLLYTLLVGLGLVGGLPVSFGTVTIDVVLLSAVEASPWLTALVERPELGGVLLSVGLVLSLVATYLTAAGLANYATERRFRSAFDVRRLAEGALTRTFATAWVKAMAASTAGWVLVLGGVVISSYGVLPGAKFVTIGFLDPEITVVSPNGLLFFSYVIAAAASYFVLLRYSYGIVGRAWAESTADVRAVRSREAAERESVGLAR